MTKHILTGILTMSTVSFSASQEALWPAKPIPVSPVEGLIEGFWSPTLDALSRWHSEPVRATRSWDACHLKLAADSGGHGAQITRAYHLTIDGWQRLRVRLRPGAGVKTVIAAEVDGAEQVVADHTATDSNEIEIVGPVDGTQLTRLTLRFHVSGAPRTGALDPADAAVAKTHSVLLRWIMLERDGDAWMPPAAPFEGMIAATPSGSFQPGLGLVFGSAELRQMRQAAAEPSFGSLWQQDLEHAASQFQADPASVIRPYVLYVPTRYGRRSDLDIDTGRDGLTLALVGLIGRNEAYMRQAARYAIALASIDEWAEGFIDRVPEAQWTHAGFAPNVATVKAALLLDWTWNWLTPEGREFVRDAIRGKGLTWLRGMERRMANQGIRFTKGLVLGHMAVADSMEDPALQKTVRQLLNKLNRKVDDAARPDGTFSEGMGYGKGTMASLPITYVAAGRCLKQPMADLVSERFLPAMRFILTAENGIAPSFAAFSAGVLGDDLFADQCVPTSVMAAYKGPAWHSTGGNACEYVFYGLIPVWAPDVRPAAPQPNLPPFSVFPDGGWVFVGSDTPEAPRISFESGLWDGHGHSWYHKHAITLAGWGEPLLITRHHLAYSDARSRATMCTTLYNTFDPGGRDQDATGTPGRGARLIKAEDRGNVVLVESDNATAWRHNVKRAVRRALFIRPHVLIVQDVVELGKPETGVQSWNSLHPWEMLEGLCATSRARKAAVRLSCFGPPETELSAGEDSVHRCPEGEVPVYRAAFTSPRARRHRLFTVIEAIPPQGTAEPASIKVLDQGVPLIEIQQGNSVVRVAGGDGDLSVAVQEKADTSAALDAADTAPEAETPAEENTTQKQVTQLLALSATGRKAIDREEKAGNAQESAPGGSPEPPGLGSRTAFVADGRIVSADTTEGRWQARNGYLESTGQHYLYAGNSLGDGDFTISARVSLDELDGTAAAFVMDGNQFGFEGRHRRMFVKGPQFGPGRPIADPDDFITPDKPFHLQVSRTGDRLTFRIDGKDVWTTPYPARQVRRFGLRPWRATMRIYDFAASGNLIDASAAPPSRRHAGVSIPTIDISGETDRHVVVAPGTKTDYRGQVNTVLMADGKTMFAVWSIGHGGMCGPLKRSDDGGRTWSDMLPTPENWGEVGSCPCIFRLTDAQGVERLFVFAGRPRHYRSVSLDGGTTWTPMEPTGLFKPGGNTAVIAIENGRKHLLLMQRGPADKPSDQSTQAVWQAVSADGGLTWEDYRKVCELPGAVPCEPEVIRSPDGGQLACLMRENSRRLNSLIMFSDDDGGTWTPPREVPASLTGDRHMSCFAPDGRLVVVFRDRAVGSQTYGHYVAWVGTYDDIRNGRSGQYRVKLLHSHAGPDCGYSGLECLPDGTLVATTYIKYRPGPEKHSIISVRFKLTETDARLPGNRPGN